MHESTRDSGSLGESRLTPQRISRPKQVIIMYLRKKHAQKQNCDGCFALGPHTVSTSRSREDTEGPNMWYQNPTQICDATLMTGTEMTARSPSRDPDPFNSKKKPWDMTKKTGFLTLTISSSHGTRGCCF